MVQSLSILTRESNLTTAFACSNAVESTRLLCFWCSGIAGYLQLRSSEHTRGRS